MQKDRRSNPGKRVFSKKGKGINLRGEINQQDVEAARCGGKEYSSRNYSQKMKDKQEIAWNTIWKTHP